MIYPSLSLSFTSLILFRPYLNPFVVLGHLTFAGSRVLVGCFLFFHFFHTLFIIFVLSIPAGKPVSHPQVNSHGGFPRLLTCVSRSPQIFLSNFVSSPVTSRSPLYLLCPSVPILTLSHPTLASCKTSYLPRFPFAPSSEYPIQSLVIRRLFSAVMPAFISVLLTVHMPFLATFVLSCFCGIFPPHCDQPPSQDHAYKMIFGLFFDCPPVPLWGRLTSFLKHLSLLNAFLFIFTFVFPIAPVFLLQVALLCFCDLRLLFAHPSRFAAHPIENSDLPNFSPFGVG